MTEKRDVIQRNIQEDLEALEELLLETSFNIQVLLEEVQIYDDTPYYTKNPEAAIELLGSDLIDIIESIQEAYLNEMSGLDEEKKVEIHDKMADIYLTIKSILPVSSIILRDLFSKLDVELESPTTIKPEKKRKPYRVESKIMKTHEIEEFLRKCGLEEDKKRGKGSHTEFRDPQREMSGFETHSEASNNIQLRAIITRLHAKGLPLDRIDIACNKLRLPFRLRK